jgi:hypothetical protein
MPSSFTAYAPPLFFGPWSVATSHTGRARVRLSASPIGDTEIFGEVRYYDSSNTQVVKSWHRQITFDVGDSYANIEVRFKGVPLGSAVEGEVSMGGVPSPPAGGGPGGASASDSTVNDGDKQIRIGVTLDVENPTCGTGDIEPLIDQALARAKKKLLLDLIQPSVGPSGANEGGQCKSHDRVTFDKTRCD